MSEHRKVHVKLGDTGFTSEIRVGDHFYLADEPVSAGGKDLGPAPYELLASALGACTVMTLRMYADLKKWDLKGINVELAHRKEDSEDGKSKIDIFTREIEFMGDLDEKQRERMLAIANKCPVHKTLSASSSIETSEVKSN